MKFKTRRTLHSFFQDVTMANHLKLHTRLTIQTHAPNYFFFLPPFPDFPELAFEELVPEAVCSGFLVLPTCFGTSSATLSINAFREGISWLTKLPSSLFNCTRTRPLCIKSLEYALSSSMAEGSLRWLQQSAISTQLGLSHALLALIRRPSAIVFLEFI